jgi:hypothetical protein
MELCLIGWVDGVRQVAPFLRISGQSGSEITGPAFGPDGTRLYLSSQRGVNGTGITYEITGPFRTSPGSPVTTTPTTTTQPPATTQPTTTTQPGVTLVAAGSVWRYLDDGSNQGTAWRARGFDDRSWRTGAAPLGYGDPVTTVVGFGSRANRKHVTTYFRRTFAASGGSTRLVLRLRRDDGAVVYLNGVEVARSNMPSGTVAYRTLAFAAGSSEQTYLTHPDHRDAPGRRERDGGRGPPGVALQLRHGVRRRARRRQLTGSPGFRVPGGEPSLGRSPRRRSWRARRRGRAGAASPR